MINSKKPFFKRYVAFFLRKITINRPFGAFVLEGQGVTVCCFEIRAFTADRATTAQGMGEKGRYSDE
jgi:hypothetical protein